MLGVEVGRDDDRQVLGVQDELRRHGVDQHALGLHVGVVGGDAPEDVVPQHHAVLLGVALGDRGDLAPGARAGQVKGEPHDALTADLGEQGLHERAEEAVRDQVREELPPVLVRALVDVLAGVRGQLQVADIGVDTAAEREEVDRHEPGGHRHDGAALEVDEGLHRRDRRRRGSEEGGTVRQTIGPMSIFIAATKVVPIGSIDSPRSRHRHRFVRGVRHCGLHPGPRGTGPRPVPPRLDGPDRHDLWADPRVNVPQMNSAAPCFRKN